MDHKLMTAIGLATAITAVGLIGFEVGAQSARSQMYAGVQVQPIITTSAPLNRGYLRAANAVPSQTFSAPWAAAQQNDAGSFSQGNLVLCGLAVASAAVAAFVTAFAQRKPALPAVTLLATAGKKVRPTPAPAAASTERLLWIPGVKAPEHLNNTLVGDRGFDPLNLGKNPNALERFRVSEVFHGRLAMLAFAGALVPELLRGVAWYDAVHTPDPITLTTFLLVLAVATGPIELWRYDGRFPAWEEGEEPEPKVADIAYPGADPFEWSSEEAKLKELKNGRLAMIAVLGFYFQHAKTGASPIENLVAFINDGANITTAMFATAGKKVRPTPAPAAASTERLLWIPGAKAPEHLNNTLVGDRGFDPLNLGKDPNALERFRVSEVFHGRLAMLAFAGALVPELLRGVAWYDAVHTPDPITLTTFLLVLAGATGPIELWRYDGRFPAWEEGEELEPKVADIAYPGADPFEWSSEEAKLKELKNGRLAMIAVLGFYFQHAKTGASPIENLVAFINDGANITTAMF